MKMHDLISHLQTTKPIDIEEIAAIRGDVIGSSLFINILLSVGAFLSSFMMLGAILAFFWGILDLGDDYIWLMLGIVAVIMMVLGTIIQSKTSIFQLRLATYFMVIGKLAVVWLIYERVGDYVGFDYLIKNLKYYAPLAVFIAIINMYVGKIKLEIFIVLLVSIVFLRFALLDDFTWVLGARSRIDIPIYYGYFVKAVLWLYSAILLFKYNLGYKNRLPFYALILAQISVSTAYGWMYKSGEVTIINDFWVGISNQFTRTGYHLILLAPSLYLILMLLKKNQCRVGWQYIVGFILLLIGTFFPLGDLYIILFCFIYGYAKRDRYILFSAYILMPIFIYKLYRSLELTLSTASLLAMIIGVSLLAIYAVVRFSKFETEAAK